MTELDVSCCRVTNQTIVRTAYSIKNNGLSRKTEKCTKTFNHMVIQSDFN